MESKIKEALVALVEYIERRDVNDEFVNDGDGHVDGYRSVEFGLLIDRAREALSETRDDISKP